MTSLEKRLERGEVVVIDGATGTELQRRGVPMSDVAWCGTATLTHPDALRAVHADYIRAGADVIITNTFASARQMLEPAGLGDRVEAINRRAVELAREAREQAAEREVWIAGSISTMAARDRDEAQPEPARAAANYREQAEILADAGVELIALEMMLDLERAPLAVAAARATGLPVWVGFSCHRAGDGSMRLWREANHDSTRNPEFAEAIAAILAAGCDAAGIMHSEIAETGPALEVLRAHWSGPLLAYAESGGWEMPNWRFTDVVSPETYLAAARGWVAQGVQIVGGCCGIGPAHIAALREGLPETLGG